MPTIVAYIYEEDIHCFGCTIRKFGYIAVMDRTAWDDEGNLVQPVFSTDEIAEPQEGCGTCGEPLE